MLFFKRLTWLYEQNIKKKYIYIYVGLPLKISSQRAVSCLKLKENTRFCLLNSLLQFGTSHTFSLIAHSYTAILYIKPSRRVQAVVFGDVVITIWCYCITMKCWCIVGFMKTDFYGVYLFCAAPAASEQLADLPWVVVGFFFGFFLLSAISLGHLKHTDTSAF